MSAVGVLLTTEVGMLFTQLKEYEWVEKVPALIAFEKRLIN